MMSRSSVRISFATIPWSSSSLTWHENVSTDNKKNLSIGYIALSCKASNKKNKSFNFSFGFFYLSACLANL